VPVLYDPSRVINRFAASNKLAEALSIGRPVILNDELEIANELPDAVCIIRVHYVEADDVGSRLRALIKDPAKYAEACVEARRVYEANYDWEIARRDSLSALIGDNTSLTLCSGVKSKLTGVT
jgi:glycosyltransferase involved in cell wall biosynthesis